MSRTRYIVEKLIIPEGDQDVTEIVINDTSGAHVTNKLRGTNTEDHCRVKDKSYTVEKQDDKLIFPTRNEDYYRAFRDNQRFCKVDDKTYAVDTDDDDITPRAHRSNCCDSIGGHTETKGRCSSCEKRSLLKSHLKYAALISILEQLQECEEETVEKCYCREQKHDCSLQVPPPEKISEDVFKENWLKKLEALQQKETMLNDKEALLYRREVALNEKAAAVSNKETMLNNKESILNQQEAMLNEKEAVLRYQETMMNDKEVLLHHDETSLIKREKKLRTAEKEWETVLEQAELCLERYERKTRHQKVEYSSESPFSLSSDSSDKEDLNDIDMEIYRLCYLSDFGEYVKDTRKNCMEKIVLDGECAKNQNKEIIQRPVTYLERIKNHTKSSEQETVQNNGNYERTEDPIKNVSRVSPARVEHINNATEDHKQDSSSDNEPIKDTSKNTMQDAIASMESLKICKTNTMQQPVMNLKGMKLCNNVAADSIEILTNHTENVKSTTNNFVQELITHTSHIKCPTTNFTEEVIPTAEHNKSSIRSTTQEAIISVEHTKYLDRIPTHDSVTSMEKTKIESQKLAAVVNPDRKKEIDKNEITEQGRARSSQCRSKKSSSTSHLLSGAFKARFNRPAAYGSMKYKTRPKISYDDLNSTLSADVGDASFVKTSKKFNPAAYKMPFIFTRSASERYLKQTGKDFNTVFNDLLQKPINIKEDRVLQRVNENITASQESTTKFQDYGLIDQKPRNIIHGQIKSNSSSLKEKMYPCSDFEEVQNGARLKAKHHLHNRPTSWNGETNLWLQNKRDAYKFTVNRMPIEDFGNDKENVRCVAQTCKADEPTRKKENRSKIFGLFG